METLLDGKGRGYVAEIDSNNRLQTVAVTIPRIAFVSEGKGDAFRILSGFLTVTTSLGCVFWLKNTSSTQHFHIEKFNVSWDGGSTSFNKPIIMELRGGVSEPSANRTASGVIGLNSTIPKTPSVSAYSWDEVSTGMTVASTGALTGTGIFSQGTTSVEPQGAIVLGSGGSLGIFAKGAEVGELTVTVEGYFEDN